MESSPAHGELADNVTAQQLLEALRPHAYLEARTLGLGISAAEGVLQRAGLIGATPRFVGTPPSKGLGRAIAMMEEAGLIEVTGAPRDDPFRLHKAHGRIVLR